MNESRLEEEQIYTGSQKAAVDSSGRCEDKSVGTVVVTARACGTGRTHQYDSARSWLICICGLVSSIIVLGFVFSFGVLNPVLLGEFKQGKGRTAWVGSLCMAAASFFGPVAGRFCNRFGSRVVAMCGALTCVSSLLASSQVSRMWMLYLTYSCLFGFGTCCVHTAVFLVVSRSFRKRRSLATGILVAGHAAGVMIVNPVLQVLLDFFGWRKSFLVMAGVTFFICILACAFEINPEKEIQTKSSIEEDNRKGSSKPLSIWKHPPFVVYTISTAVLYLGLHVPQLHMASYCKDMGIDGDQAARLYMGLGLASLISRIVVGRICDFKKFLARPIYQGAGLVMGIATLLCPLANSYTGLMVYFVIFGLAEGLSATPINLLILTCLPEEERHRSFGFWLLSLSLTTAAGPPFADELGSYVPAFYMAGGVIIISSLVVFLLRCIQKEDTKHTLDTKEIGLLVSEKVTVL